MCGVDHEEDRDSLKTGGHDSFDGGDQVCEQTIVAGSLYPWRHLDDTRISQLEETWSW